MWQFAPHTDSPGLESGTSRSTTTLQKSKLIYDLDQHLSTRELVLYMKSFEVLGEAHKCVKMESNV